MNYSFPCIGVIGASLVLLAACSGPPPSAASVPIQEPPPTAASEASLKAPLAAQADPPNAPPTLGLMQRRATSTLSGPAEGILVRGPIAGVALIPLRETTDAQYYLIRPDERPWVVSPFAQANARRHGFENAALVRVETSQGRCAPGYVCLAQLTRLDGSAAIPVDVDRVVTDVLTGLAERFDIRDWSARAGRHAERALGAPTEHAHGGFVFRPWWSPEQAQLSLLVVALERRAQLATEQVERFGCDAPPGADCAPDWYTDIQRIWRIGIGEAGTTLVFNARGEPASTTSIGEGARPLFQFEAHDDVEPW